MQDISALKTPRSWREIVEDAEGRVWPAWERIVYVVTVFALSLLSATRWEPGDVKPYFQKPNPVLNTLISLITALFWIYRNQAMWAKPTKVRSRCFLSVAAPLRGRPNPARSAFNVAAMGTISQLGFSISMWTTYMTEPWEPQDRQES